MERSSLSDDRIREDLLAITNSFLRVGKEPTVPNGFHVYWTDVDFFQSNFGIKLFEKPLLAVNVSDEDIDEPTATKLDSVVVQRTISIDDDGIYEDSVRWGDFCQTGWDEHLNIYSGSSPVIFGVVYGQGEFGHHSTRQGISVFKSRFYSDINDEDVVDALQKTFLFSGAANDDLVPGDVRRKLFVANIETGQIIYRETMVIQKEIKSPETFLTIFGDDLLHIALTGRYFVCIGRPDRIGAYLENKDRFDFNGIDKLIGR